MLSLYSCSDAIWNKLYPELVNRGYVKVIINSTKRMLVVRGNIDQYLSYDSKDRSIVAISERVNHELHIFIRNLPENEKTEFFLISGLNGCLNSNIVAINVKGDMVVNETSGFVFMSSLKEMLDMALSIRTYALLDVSEDLWSKITGSKFFKTAGYKVRNIEELSRLYLNKDDVLGSAYYMPKDKIAFTYSPAVFSGMISEANGIKTKFLKGIYSVSGVRKECR